MEVKKKNGGGHQHLFTLALLRERPQSKVEASGVKEGGEEEEGEEEGGQRRSGESQQLRMANDK